MAAPALMERLGARLFKTPPPTRQPERERIWAQGATRQVLETDAGQLAVWTWGRGSKAVLLVHGWAARGLQLGGLAQGLREHGFKVVAFDAPGHGASPGRTSSLIEMARAISAVAHELGGAQAVVSHSLGATATMLALGRHELEAERLVFLSPSSSLSGIIERFGDLVGLTPEVVGRIRRRLARQLHFGWQAAEPLSIAPRMTAPLLVIHDSTDRFVRAAEGAALVRSWPGAELHTTEGLGHHRLLRDAQVIDRVISFLVARTAEQASQRDQSNRRLTA